MRLNTRSILSLLVLLTFLPATIGYAFFRHSCSICHYSKVETALAVVMHSEDDHECYCVEDCESEDHEHECDMYLKKLELPFTSEDDDIKLITPVVHDDSLVAATLCTSGDFCTCNDITIRETLPSVPISGQSLLVQNCVFRLWCSPGWPHRQASVLHRNIWKQWKSE